MKTTMLTLLAALLVATTVFAAPMTYDNRLDIDEMLNEAQGVWDLGDHDSIILLESVRYSWSTDMRLSETHHRVVWISTEHGIDHYADLRIPYDSDRQELKVDALRVWREGRWVEHRPTAIVPTTPYAFRHAPDYTGIRETMLLHDGVELPCIMECSYTIEDKERFRGGFEGQFIFPQNDPTLNSWLIVEADEGLPLFVEGFNGVVEADGNVDGMAQMFSFRMKKLEAAPLPETSDPAAYLPHVQWSTYPNWNALGNLVKSEFAMRSMMDDVLTDSVDVLIADAETMVEKAHLIADFVDSHVRYIDYDKKWFMPRIRMAGRTYETGYGVAVDQCMLTASLMRHAGFEVWPVLLGEGFGNVDQNIATFARFQTPGVWVSGPGVEAYWDPSSGTLHNGLAPIYNRTVWLPGFDDKPTLRWSGDGQGSRIMTSFDLSWCSESESWVGDAYYEAGGGFSPFDQMEGGGDRSDNYLNRMVSGVFGSAKVTAFSPMSFDRFTVASDLSVTVPAADCDDLGRKPFVIGAPTGGLLDMVPRYAPLYLANRGTPVPLPGSGEQMVKVKLHLGDFELYHLPEAVSLSNDAGSFELTVDQDGDVVTITRYINIAKSHFTALEWPQLRELLLAEANAANRTVLLK